MHVAINAAEECEIRRERRDAGIGGIVHFDSDDVVGADVEPGCHIENERRESALVFARQIAVYINIRNDIGTVEFEEETAVGVAGVRGVVGSIPADASVVIVAPVLPIEVIPSVR